jgi:hypothetical protein|tara:strand:+ start:4293 stop:4826 length:534 start_codon:yes stop_codon:yes gene_type:complete
MHRKVSLNIDYNKFIDTDYAPHGKSVIHDWQRILKEHLPEDYKKYGYPYTFNYANTWCWQKFWDEDELDYNEYGSKLNMQVLSISSIKQPPGCLIPWHRDTFYKVQMKHPDNTNPIVRANIFLQDWDIGHFLQYDKTVDYNWKQGEGHMWDHSVAHIGANVGLSNKYTLQISGFLLS